MVLRTLHPASPRCSPWHSLPSCFIDSISHSDSDKSRKDSEQPTRYEQWIFLKIWKKLCSRAFLCHVIAWHSNYQCSVPLCCKWSATKAKPDQLIYPHDESELEQSWLQFYHQYEILQSDNWHISCGSKSKNSWRRLQNKLNQCLKLSLTLFTNCSFSRPLRRRWAVCLYNVST